MFKLYAERGTDKRWMASAGSLQFLEVIIEVLEKAGDWPEGFEAYAYEENTENSWWYDDKWNLIKPIDGGLDDEE